MASLGFKDIYKATEGQTRFKTSQPFLPHELHVYLNGIASAQGEHADYIVEDNLHIVFTYPLEEGDSVILSNSQSTDQVDVEVVGYKSALFNLYNQSIQLLNNHKYQAIVRLNGKDIKWGFTSRYEPMLTSVKKVRSTTGEMLDELSDERINFMIYLNSKEAESMTQDISADEKPRLEEFKRYWVLYKTCMDIVNAVYLTMSGRVGSVSKQIGPVTVSKTYKIPFIEDMLCRFENLQKKYEGYLSEQLVSDNFVKAGTQGNFPYQPRVTF